MKKIVQILPTLAYGDAIGNEVLAIKKALLERGYRTEIYAENIDGRLPRGTAKKIDKYKDSSDNIILYHLSTGTELNNQLLRVKGKLIIRYHNITPPEFFKDYSENSASLCSRGIEGVKKLAKCADYCIAVSVFNKQDLIRLGYTCPIEVIPIILDFSSFEEKPSETIIHKYTEDKYTNIIFTGRVAPNKKHEDLIKSFYLYQKHINPKSRLILVGSYNTYDLYYRKLSSYIDALKLTENVIFTGHVSFNEILAYYKIADLFLCLSEHEGFCVPLVESMYFRVPIIAYSSTAVGETLGDGGVLLSDKDPRVVAEAMNLVLTNHELKEKIIRNQEERIQYFTDKRHLERMLKCLLD